VSVNVWSRRRWLWRSYGPGGVATAFGAVLCLVAVAAWDQHLAIEGGIMLTLGLALLAGGRASLYVYRYGYFKGRADQMVDEELARRGWHMSRRLDPWPWDESADWPIEEEVP
jgi:hypothetical protein